MENKHINQYLSELGYDNFSVGNHSFLWVESKSKDIESLRLHKFDLFNKSDYIATIDFDTKQARVYYKYGSGCHINQEQLMVREFKQWVKGKVTKQYKD